MQQHTYFETILVACDHRGRVRGRAGYPVTVMLDDDGEIIPDLRPVEGLPQDITTEQCQEYLGNAGDALMGLAAARQTIERHESTMSDQRDKIAALEQSVEQGEEIATSLRARITELEGELSAARADTARLAVLEAALATTTAQSNPVAAD